jgi:hypothetical protein
VTRKKRDVRNRDGFHGIQEDAFPLQRKADTAIAQFVDGEVDIGLLFCELASQRADLPGQIRFLQNARRAHDLAQGLIWKIQHIPYTQFVELTAKLERLRSRIEHF